MLDPRRSGLSPEEEYQRSRNLLELALDSLKQCAGLAPSEAVTDLMEGAAKELKKRGSADGDIELAQRLWQMRKTICGQAVSRQAMPGSDEALELVMGKLAQ